MKFKKKDYWEFFLYVFYLLSAMLLLFGIYFKEFYTIELGLSLYLFGTFFVNQGTIYYSNKILILGFLKIDIENISKIEMEDKKIIIKYDNGTERKIKFISELSSKSFFDFLKNIKLT
ncbi:hypothetical protein [Streptobacillus ratti]|uniref:hypothetical protein n=1 Tax=Streptobacillus ratti TaxID=1720557 RepID=UPI001FC9D654|nr:hypothetical protein [Streptobacillus ratti]